MGSNPTDGSTFMKRKYRKKMPAKNKSTEFISGTLYWAKVVGSPVPNYGGDAREWTFELVPDAKGLAILKKYKLTDRLKDKEDEKNPDKGEYIVLRKKEYNYNGEVNQPIRLYDVDNKEWDRTKLIGNGSKADVKVDIRDYGPGKKQGVYPVAIRITEHVPYQSSEFGAMDEEVIEPVKRAKNAPVELDDEPFDN